MMTMMWETAWEKSMCLFTTALKLDGNLDCLQFYNAWWSEILKYGEEASSL